MKLTDTQLVLLSAASQRDDGMFVRPASMIATAAHAAVAGGPEGLCEEGPERRVRHLAGGHRELPMPASLVGMPVDPDVIGGIKKSRIDPVPVPDHRLQEGKVTAIAAADAVICEPPNVAGLAARGHCARRDDVIVRVSAVAQEHVELTRREPGDAEVEVEVEASEFSQLHLEQVQVPAGVDRDLVVGKP